MEEIERFLPGMEGPIWYEHWHRYHFVVPMAAGKAVVDAACGDGYGSALLARHAQRVTGVDASAETVAAARRRYGEATNLEYVEGRCESLPVADASVDLAVSFETIEHLDEPRALIAEAARVLRPDGVFVVSTPNKSLYSDAVGYRNPFHPSELYEGEFVDALRERFAAVTLLGQRVDAFSAIWPMDRAPRDAQLLDAPSGDGAAAAPFLPAPLYFIALCAASPQALEAAAARFSLFSEREHRLYEGMWAQRALAAAALAQSQQRVAALTEERDRLAAQLRAHVVKP